MSDVVSSRPPILRLLSAACTVAMVSASCADRDSVRPAEVSSIRTGELVDVQQPVEELVTAELGLSREQIAGIVLDAQALNVGRCMSDAGFEMIKGELFDSESQLRQLRILRGEMHPTAAQDALSALESGRLTAESEAPVARSRQLTECQGRASGEVQNPLSDFSRWLDLEQSALRDRALTDVRLRVARERGRECIGALGYPADTAGDLATDFQNRVNVEVANFNQSSLSNQELVFRLTSIAQEEKSLETVVDTCAVQEYQVLYTVLAEVEASFLDENEPAVRDKLKRLKPEVEKLVATFASPQH